MSSTRHFSGSAVPKALATMASASAAFLVSGSAEGAVHSKTINVSMTGDTNAEIFVLHMTAGGDLAYARVNSLTGMFPYVGGTSMPFMLLAGDPLGTFGRAIGAYGFVVGGSSLVSRLASGAIIGTNPSASFTFPIAAITHSTITGTWLSGTSAPLSGYIGFAVSPDASPPVFGWVAVTVDAVNSLTITGYGWEDTVLTPIAAGAQGAGSAGQGGGGNSGTPEPTASGLALLAMGAAGVMRHRRRRSSAAA